ncbi:hypothetical protein T10_101 [Trichinella papuae]|uniref:Uncharacterized protein n=1 Tax=Trichinella papuae TaxID=268474 RepID=A0A0V1M2I9_9BILA|nr:hypothetical protein T10_101 [Trichinella papuae]
MHKTLRTDIEKDRIKIYNGWCATMRRVLGMIRLNGKEYTKKGTVKSFSQCTRLSSQINVSIPKLSVIRVG